MDRPSWFRIENLADETADVFVYNEIGFGGITADAFITDLRGVTASTINLHLNSPGGDVFDGIAIYGALRDHPANVIVHVDALAASIASVIAMAGDKIIMARHSSMMIHDAHGVAMGDAEAMQVMADRLDVVSNQIAGIYQERVPGSKTVTWRNRMRAETWYTEDQAVAAGLADEVGARATVTNSFDLSKFHNAPLPRDPYPNEGEDKEDFMRRCVADPRINKESCERHWTKSHPEDTEKKAAVERPMSEIAADIRRSASIALTEVLS